MSRVDPNRFHYFSAAENRVVPRYGSTGFIGARFVQNKGFVVDTNVVVKITDAAYRKHLKAYRRAIQDKSLCEKTESDYKAYVEQSEKKAKDEAEAAKKKAKAEAEASDGNPDADTTTSGSNSKRSSGNKEK